PNNLALGSTFDGGMIDPNRETITFAVPHNFLTGDGVVYEPGQGNLGTVPGLTSGATYYVVVIDPKTIHLVSTNDPALSPENYIKTFTPGNVSSNPITSLNNGFSPHEAVIYHSPAPQTFYTGQVNVDASVSNNQATLSDPPGASNIYFVDGDAHPVNP